jgi:DNA-binding HxlR family transcriptional regulator
MDDGAAKRSGAFPEATRQMLTQQLRQLEADGIVRRTVHPVVPPRVNYELTAMGKELEPVLSALEKWGGRVLAYRNRLPQSGNVRRNSSASPCIAFDKTTSARDRLSRYSM